MASSLWLAPSFSSGPLLSRMAKVSILAPAFRALGIAVFSFRAAFVTDGEVLDVALVLEDLGDRALQLGRRHHRLRMPDHLGVADPDQHVGDGIGHAHRSLLAPLFALMSTSLP